MRGAEGQFSLGVRLTGNAEGAFIKALSKMIAETIGSSGREIHAASVAGDLCESQLIMREWSERLTCVSATGGRKKTVHT